MLTLLRRRLAHDDGLSIMEMMVALVIIAVALSALASSIVTSLAAVARDERRVRATHLANQLIENLRGIPWDEVTFYGNDGAPSDFDGNPTVILTDSDGNELDRPAPDTTNSPLPIDSETIDDIVYAITTNIYWIDDPADGTGIADDDPNDLKGFHVLIQWDLKGRPFEFESTGTRAPTPEEVPVRHLEEEETIFFGISAFNVDPVEVLLNPGGTTQEPVTVTVTTSLPSLQPVLTIRDADGNLAESARTMDPVSGSDTLFRTVYNAGIGLFSAGHYVFEVTANEVPPGVGYDEAEEDVVFVFTPTEANVQIVDTVSPPSPTWKHVRTPEITTTKFCTTNGQDLRWPIEITFEVTGVGTAVADSTARITWTSDAGAANAVYVSANASNTGVIYTATIPLTGWSAKFKNATTTVQIFATRKPDNTQAEASFVYDIQRGAGSGCP